MAFRACCFESSRGDRGSRLRAPGIDPWCTHRPRRQRQAPHRELSAAPVADRATLLVYVLDIYDPRAYEYLPSVATVLRAACRLVDVEVVQSGRYAPPLAGAGMIALLATEQAPVPQVLEAVQDEFFLGGRTLDDPGVLHRVASTLSLDADAVELFAASDRAAQLCAEDAELARDLDRRGGPLLLASHGERVFEFDGPGASAARLVDQFNTVLAR